MIPILTIKKVIPRLICITNPAVRVRAVQIRKRWITALSCFMGFAIISGGVFLLGFGKLASLHKKPGKLVLSGPPAAVSFPLAYALATGELRDVAQEVEFKVWTTPDQLRTMALNGETSIMAMPSNVAANLYNRKIQIQPVNISTWGILFMISRDKNRTRLNDYKNEEIVIPFRGDMPDIIFRLLTAKQGLSMQKDFKIRYVASPLDAMQLLLTRRARHVVLPEPAVSMALRKSGSFPIRVVAPTLFRSMSFQEEWGKVFKTKDIMPQAGIVAVGKASNDARLIKRIHEIYEKALNKCEANRTQCGKVIAPYFTQLSAEAISDSLSVSKLKAKKISSVQKELKYFFQKLYDTEPALLGGRMPGERFYKWP